MRRASGDGEHCVPWTSHPQRQEGRLARQHVQGDARSGTPSGPCWAMTTTWSTPIFEIVKSQRDY